LVGGNRREIGDGERVEVSGGVFLEELEAGSLSFFKFAQRENIEAGASVAGGRALQARFSMALFINRS
jgi:hypothetical protein